jgi:hypothetical protein
VTLGSAFTSLENIAQSLRPQGTGTELAYVRGALIAFEPGGYPSQDKRRVIPFRFNPESLTRTVQVQAGQRQPGVEGAAHGASAPPSAEAAADSASGTLKESFSIQIRLDFADRDQSVSAISDEFGIAPEIAAIEDLLYPAPSRQNNTGSGTAPSAAMQKRPTVLFVWGRSRVVAVRIASLKIEETVYNDKLYPVRAEIEASLEVLGEQEARDDTAVRAALDHTSQERQKLAQQYYDNTAAQGSNILPLP